MIQSNAKSLLDNTAMLNNKQQHQGMMCVWIKGHLSAKSVKIVVIFYLYRGKIQILNPFYSNGRIFYCYPARCMSIMFGKQ